MKRVLLAVLLSLASILSAQEPKTVKVPDASTAIAIAKSAATRIYGKHHIEREEPLNASLHDGIWTVYGTLCCPDGKGELSCEVGSCVGGAVLVKVRQRDGKVLSVTHTK